MTGKKKNKSYEETPFTINSVSSTITQKWRRVEGQPWTGKKFVVVIHSL
jgi:hypothetical protein